MNRQSTSTLAIFVLFSSLALAGCGGGWHLRPVTARANPGSILAAGHIASVQVMLAPELEADKVQMLAAYNVPGEMQRVLTGVGYGQTPFAMQIYITQFRNGFGPARMHTRIIVTDPMGAVARDFEIESMTMRGGNKGSRLLRIAQHNVQSIADAL